MHDTLLGRTTTSTGKVSEVTLAKINQLRLRNGQGQPTRYRIPTLRDAMEHRLRSSSFSLMKSRPSFNVLMKIRERRARVWVNTLWPRLSAGHDDDLAVTNIHESYG